MRKRAEPLYIYICLEPATRILIGRVKAVNPFPSPSNFCFNFRIWAAHPDGAHQKAGPSHTVKSKSSVHAWVLNHGTWLAESTAMHQVYAHTH